MTGSLALPFWILALVGALALWAALDRILMPSARWFLRRRLNRMIEEVNTRLELQIPPFLQTKRRVLIDQISYDPQVMEAIDAEAEATGTPREGAEPAGGALRPRDRALVQRLRLLSRRLSRSPGARWKASTACALAIPTTRRWPASSPAPASSS